MSVIPTAKSCFKNLAKFRTQNFSEGTYRGRVGGYLSLGTSTPSPAVDSCGIASRKLSGWADWKLNDINDCPLSELNFIIALLFNGNSSLAVKAMMGRWIFKMILLYVCTVHQLRISRKHDGCRSNIFPSWRKSENILSYLDKALTHLVYFWRKAKRTCGTMNLVPGREIRGPSWKKLINRIAIHKRSERIDMNFDSL